MDRLAIRRRRSIARKFMPIYIMMIPGLAYLLINNYLPMLGLFIAFKNINFAKGLFRSPWVGFQNFEFLFKSADAFVITRNTLLYNASFVCINTVVAVTIAILLNEVRQRSMLRVYQSLVLLPNLISMVIVSYLVYAFLSIDTGFMNKTILPALGLTPASWYAEPKYWPFILPLVNTWKWFGFLCVIYLASIVSISKDYYEAAEIAGAGRWSQVWHITIPLIRPTIITMVLLAIGRIFYSDFGLFYQVPRNAGALFSTTNVVDTYVYRALLQLGDFGMSSAAGLYQSVIGFVLVMVSNLVVRRLSPENALF